MPAISPPATVLVTGITGFIGSHVAHAYLSAGFAVRGTARSATKGEHLRSLFERDFPGKFELVVADIEDADSLVSAARGVDGIAHVASPIFRPPPMSDPQLLIGPAVNGTLNVLKAAAKSGTVKRVVITGSVGAIRDPSAVSPTTYSSRDWNDYSVKQVEQLGPKVDANGMYYASKVLAERGATKWVEENKPGFDLAYVLPAWTFGPVLTQFSSVDQLPDTPKELYNVFAKPRSGKELATSLPGPCIHVLDVARAHVDALVREELGGARLILALNADVTFQDYYDAYWSLPEGERPKLPFEVTKGEPQVWKAAVRDRWVNSEEVLGWSYRSLSIMVRDNLEDIATQLYKV
ncbi:NAD(P)-binding protein [Auricularia subglabra TFB-10046 SS5]|nr:NAD(P)-binding protein [Auricularia subglabra TFB-10046 SS5]